MSFDTPIKFINRNWYVNERIIEVPFVLNNIELSGQGKRLLDFGCTGSYLALQLASLGYEVIGIDIRYYQFTHPNFTFYKTNILDFEDNKGFDYITSVSVLEHVGLGAYGGEKNISDLRNTTIKLTELLKPEGKIIITVPFGKESEDDFERSFSRKEILSLFNHDNMELIKENYYYRNKLKFWYQCDLTTAMTFSNVKEDRGPTGANCVGCFIWKKIEPKK
ncbi:MAG: class I SAM-dependent methyltransferase [Promethearchaeota archaeon]